MCCAKRMSRSRITLPQFCMAERRKCTSPADFAVPRLWCRFRCAEAVVRAFIDVTDQKQLRPLVAMASGFGVGMENSRSLCGALAGGVLVLGMLFGRDKPGDVKVDRCQKLAGELHDVFVIKHGSAICCALVEGLADGSPEREERCALYCADAAAMLGTIVEREWFSGACCQIGGH